MMDIEGMPCGNCCENCSFIMMSNCDKLSLYLKIKNTNDY